MRDSVERAFLVSVLSAFDVSDISYVFDVITPEMISDSNLRVIYEEVLNLYFEKGSIDSVLLAENVRSRGSEYYNLLAELLTEVYSSANIDVYVESLLDNYKKRVVRQKVYKIINDDEISADEMIESISSVIANVGSVGTDSNIIDFSNFFVDEFRKYVNSITSGVSGLRTGFDRLDGILGGISNGSIVYIAARPSVGKTAFSLNIAYNLSKNKVPVLIFSLEMSKSQLFSRFTPLIYGVSGKKFKVGAIEDYELAEIENKIEDVSKLPIYISDEPSVDVSKIRSSVKRAVNKFGVGVVIIDYMQLISPPRGIGNREQEIAFISRSLKLLAKDVNIPIIVLSQLNRSLEKREDKRPNMSDLRESGAIENDADIIMFLYSSYYHDHERRNETIIPVDVIVAKNRDGVTGVSHFLFNKEIQKFEEYVVNVDNNQF